MRGLPAGCVEALVKAKNKFSTLTVSKEVKK